MWASDSNYLLHLGIRVPVIGGVSYEDCHYTGYASYGHKSYINSLDWFFSNMKKFGRTTASRPEVGLLAAPFTLGWGLAMAVAGKNGGLNMT
jgi:hypothetical protein